MKERIERARREYAKIPKYGYARAPKPPTDLHLVTAFFHEDLSALQQIPINKADSRTVKRALRAAENLQTTATAILAMRDGELEDTAARGASTFEVLEQREGFLDKSHGTFATLEEAEGCVAFDKLTAWEIWQGDHIALESQPKS